ncbi:MAG: DapH/DapD/GlmU-related protein [Acidimicrobiales bacterium]
MSKGPAVAVARSPQIVVGARLREGAILAEGAVVRCSGGAVEVGSGSAVLENSVVVGRPDIPTRVGRRSTFGHRCLVVGATVGDLCEVGNASILMPGSPVGDRVFLGEGTLVPAGVTLSDDVVAVGRPARVIHRASAADLDRRPANKRPPAGPRPGGAMAATPWFRGRRRSCSRCGRSPSGPRARRWVPASSCASTTSCWSTSPRKIRDPQVEFGHYWATLQDPEGNEFCVGAS